MGDLDAAQKYYLKTVELLREVANIEYNQTRKFVLLSLSRAFEELSRGRPSKKSAQFAPPASQNSASSSAAVIGEMGLNEVPTISATAVATAAKMKAVDKQNVILETQLTQAVTFLEIAGEISAVHVTQKRERRERERWSSFMFFFSELPRSRAGEEGVFGGGHSASEVSAALHRYDLVPQTKQH